jgi:hypothetical protein
MTSCLTSSLAYAAQPFVERFSWLIDAFQRLVQVERVVPLDRRQPARAAR